MTAVCYCCSSRPFGSLSRSSRGLCTFVSAMTSNADKPEPTRMVESRCGAVAVGRTYLLPPLSSGGALVVRPWLRFHIPLIGRVEGWRAGVARGPDPHHVSSPLHVARNVRISRIARPHLLHAKAYGTYMPPPLPRRSA